MRIKENLLTSLERVKNAAWIKNVMNSALVTHAGGVCSKLSKNPFPMQVVFTMLYRIALDIMYITLLSPLYSDTGFAINLRLLEYVVSIFVTLVFAPFVVQILNHKTPSAIIVTLLNYLYFIPLTSYYACKGTEIMFFVLAMTYWGIMLLLQSKLPAFQLTILPQKYTHSIFKMLTLVSPLLVFFISGKYAGFRLSLDFYNVYDIRMEARTYSIPAFFSYILDNMPILMSILLIYWLIKKKYLIVIVLGITYLFYFSIYASKSTIFFFILAIIGYFLYREWMLKWIPGLVLVSVGAGIAEYQLVDSFYIVNLFFRRMMYVPVNLTEVYYEFFQKNPLNLFRNGIMGKLSFDNIYSTSIPWIIGEYVGEPGMSCNNGLLGDVFANLPIPIGLLLMPLVLVICFRVLDMVATSVNRKCLVPVCVYLASSFINSSWSVVLLSHGFLVACALLYFFPKEDDKLL